MNTLNTLKESIKHAVRENIRNYPGDWEGEKAEGMADVYAEQAWNRLQDDIANGRYVNVVFDDDLGTEPEVTPEEIANVEYDYVRDIVYEAAGLI